MCFSVPTLSKVQLRDLIPVGDVHLGADGPPQPLLEGRPLKGKHGTQVGHEAEAVVRLAEKVGDCARTAVAAAAGANGGQGEAGIG